MVEVIFSRGFLFQDIFVFLAPNNLGIKKAPESPKTKTLAFYEILVVE